MHCNQPFGQVAFESIPNNVFYQTIPPLPPSRAIGEGEVTSISIPDGSTQMYFIPTARYDRCSPFQYNNINFPNDNNFHKNVNPEYWFVRSVSTPISTGNNIQLPNLCGASMPTQLFTPYYSINLPLNRTEYYQKFHNDNATSTTDIMYFYPSLRQERTLLNHASVQTNRPSTNYKISYDEVNKCPCKVSSRCVCQESVSSMSVDSVKSVSRSHNNDTKKIQKSSKRKNKSNRSKRRDHDCECNNVVKETSDKQVTTFMDKASGNVKCQGRDTQTAQKSKRSDIKTEIWIPIKRKSRTKSNNSTNTVNFCDSQTISLTDDCTCASATETDASQ